MPAAKPLASRRCLPLSWAASFRPTPARIRWLWCTSDTSAERFACSRMERTKDLCSHALCYGGAGSFLFGFLSSGRFQLRRGGTGTGALFPLQAAAAGAGVVAADLDHPHRLSLGGTLDTGGAVAGRKALARGAGHLLPAGSSASLAHLDGKQHLDAGLPDGVHHLIERIKTLDPVFYHRVFLAIARSAMPCRSWSMLSICSIHWLSTHFSRQMRSSSVADARSVFPCLPGSSCPGHTAAVQRTPRWLCIILYRIVQVSLVVSQPR